MDQQNPYQSSAASIGSPPPSSGILRLLFSFEGRATRGQYWLINLLLGALLIGAVVFISVLAAYTEKESLSPSYLLIPVGILYLWINLAISVKRCHDRGKSGSFVLINLVPYIGGIWFFIDAGCLDGTIGPNAYGDDPKGRSLPGTTVPSGS
ncbi:MAG: DUF805 domain-containing protein [Spirochaetia bacterium]|nr:DUF805 domain-containing protein [Spirochaetia bacterium]